MINNHTVYYTASEAFSPRENIRDDIAYTSASTLMLRTENVCINQSIIQNTIVLQDVLFFLKISDLVNLAKVCKSSYQQIRNNKLYKDIQTKLVQWSTFEEKNFARWKEGHDKFEKEGKITKINYIFSINSIIVDIFSYIRPILNKNSYSAEDIFIIEKASSLIEKILKSGQFIYPSLNQSFTQLDEYLKKLITALRSINTPLSIKLSKTLAYLNPGNL